MNALVIAPQRLVRTPDGRHWAPTPPGSYQFWRRFLKVYQEVTLLTRTRPSAAPPEGWLPATGPGIEGVGVPDFHTPGELARVLLAVVRTLDTELRKPRAVHMRAPDLLSYIAAYRMERGRPYGVDIVGDPYDSFAPGAYESVLRGLYRRFIPWQLRRLCAGAAGTAYVTESALQRRYPPAAGSFTTHYSSIELDAADIVANPRQFTDVSPDPRIVFIGSLAQLSKGPDTLLDAVRALADRRRRVSLTIAGDGAYRAQLEQQAARLDVARNVEFAGRLNGWPAVREQLDRADLLVLPSRQEGLPRVVIEAMARALPCIASTVGGTGELLAAEDLVPPDDPTVLAEKIEEVLNDPARMNRMSERNRVRALDYRAHVLEERRAAFYRHVADCTASWLESR